MKIMNDTYELQGGRGLDFEYHKAIIIKLKIKQTTLFIYDLNMNSESL